MKILYIVQQSIYDLNNRWLSADSNPMMVMGIVDQLVQKTDWTIDIMLAPIESFADISNYSDLLIRPSKSVNFISKSGPISAFTNRYHFDVDYFSKVLLQGQYDVIINNIIELSRNIKTVLWWLKLPAKLVSGNYWVDCPELGEEKVPLSISYDWRQIDGAICSDLVNFTCDSTRFVFFANMRHKINAKYLREIEMKSTIWDFGFSQYEMDFYHTHSKFKKTTLVFPNRLSAINYTHHLEFIEAVNSLYGRRQDFQVVFTNPSGKVSWGWLQDNVKPLYIYSRNTLNRKKYVELLWKSDIVVSLYTIERYGGCANVEGIYCENLPVMTNYGEYPGRVESGIPLVCVDLSNLEEVLDWAISNAHIESERLRKSSRQAKVFQVSSYEAVSEKVIEDLRCLIS